MSLAFPKDVGEATLELYSQAIGGYDIDSIERACMEIVKTRTNAFYPAPGEIREAIEALPRIEQKQIEHFPKLSPEERQRGLETVQFYRFESARHKRGIHPDDVDTWNKLIEEFRLEHGLTDKRAAELIEIRRRHGRSYLQNDPNFFGDEGLYVQFGKWAFTKNRTFTLGQPKQTYLLIVEEYMKDEGIQDPESMKILIKLLSTKRQGALTR